MPSANAEEQPRIPERPEPAIRTMHSDTERLLREKKFALGDFVRKRGASPFDAEQKRLPLFAIGLASVILIAAALGLWWGIRGFSTQETIPKPTPQPVPLTLPSLFPIDQIKTIRADRTQAATFLRLVEEVAHEPGDERAITRIAVILQDGPNERSASVADIFDFYRIDPPEEFVQKITSQPILFFYREQATPRLGIAFQIKDRDRTFADLLSWESALSNDFRLFFFGPPIPATLEPFADRTFRNIDWRFLRLGEGQDAGLGYAILPTQNILVFATSRSSMEDIITRFLLGK
ncbi:MAG: hypothetical protein HY472_01425 [Candidatus Sungbacteria bacterium]|nr:hypothetical protein [Candidatus Sungbacteria bacterium]